VRAHALTAAAVATALLIGGCGSDGASTGSAKTVLERASRTPAKSADVKLALNLKLDGVERLRQPVKVSLAGPYRSNGRKALPDLDWQMRVQAAGKNVGFRVVTTRDNAFVAYGGTTYEVGTDLVRRYRDQARSQRQQKDIRKLGIDASGWLKNGKVEDNGRKVSGDLDVRRALADVNRILAKLPQGHQLTQQMIDQINEAVKTARLEVRVGADHILRSSRFDVRFDLPEELRSKARGLRGGQLSFRYAQANVNGGQKITPPSGARPITELLRGLGVPPEALLGPGAGLQSPG
jgi:hypothetical protein